MSPPAPAPSHKHEGAHSHISSAERDAKRYPPGRRHTAIEAWPHRAYRNRQLSIQTLGASYLLLAKVCSSLLIRASIASAQSCSATRLALAKCSLATTLRRCSP